jgi:hypothetical protein
MGSGPETVLGALRMERGHAEGNLERVQKEWDRTLTMLREVDFSALVPGLHVDGLRGEVEIWHDLTLEPPRRVSGYGPLLGLPEDIEEAFGYLHRVFVGMEPAAYAEMCDMVDTALQEVGASGEPAARPELRDMIVELMELGVRSSVQSLEWLDIRLSDLEPEV